MKNILSRLLIASAIVTLSACGTSSYMMDTEEDYYAPQSQQVSYNMFYDQLSPYGNWINYPGYGRVWVVNEPGFRPYQTNGHWVYTNMGWTWASNYSWGWAAFHYGRWANDPRQGWFWVPGLEWAPAWVDWRSNNSYYGWAPMAPRNWRYSRNYDPWVFVNGRHLRHQNVSQYYERPDRNTELFSSTNVIRPQVMGATLSAGPERREVEVKTNQPLRPLKITNADRAEKVELNENEIRMFRPDRKAITGSDELPRLERPIEQRRERTFPQYDGPSRGEQVQGRPDLPTLERPRRERKIEQPERPVIDRRFEQTRPATTPDRRTMERQRLPSQPEERRMPAPQMERERRTAPERVEQVRPMPTVEPAPRKKE